MPNMEQISCTNCPKRDLCTSLCPEAEAIVNQDQVEWSDTGVTHREPRIGEDDADEESVYTDPDSGRLRVYDPVRGTDEYLLSDLELTVAYRLAEGKSRAQVAKELNISMGNLRKRISVLKGKRERLTVSR